jgi:hypothetical protein
MMHAREQIIGIALICVALVVTFSVASYVVATHQPEVALDGDRCPPNPSGTSIVFVDQTDIWPAPEQERIKHGLLATAERMRKNERLVLHVVTGRAEDANAAWKGFKLCKSADPTSVDPARENERLVRADYEQHFLQPLAALLPELAKSSAAAQSPILEAIEIAMWSPYLRADAVPSRTLEIYSDLIHQTRSLTLLARRLPDPCTVLASDIGTRLKSHDWRQVRVVLHYLRNPRDAAYQGDAHRRWWVRLFYLLGAAKVFDEATPLANETVPCGTKPAKVAKR